LRLELSAYHRSVLLKFDGEQLTLSVYTEPKQFNLRAVLAELIPERVIVRIIDSDLRH
jgi:hypothetical protein